MRTRKSAPERREEIVGVTLELIGHAGLSGASTMAIARAVGISEAGIFRHFPTKNALLLAIVDKVAGQLMDRLKSAAAQSVLPYEQLRLVVDCLLGTVRDTPAMPAILLSRELHHENAVLRAAVFQRLCLVHELMAGIIRAGVASGVFRAGLDIDRAAFMVIGLLQGLVVRWSLSDRQLDLLDEGHCLFEMLQTGLMVKTGEKA